jgi:hypothetical protein
MDDEGNLVRQHPLQGTGSESRGGAPPVYGQHVLDQLYDDVDQSGLQTPLAQSGTSSPYYAHSRVGSSEDLLATVPGIPIPPAALSSRLQSMPLDHASRHAPSSFRSSISTTSSLISAPSDGSGDTNHSQTTNATSPPQSAPLMMRNNSDGFPFASPSPGIQTPEHVDHPDIAELSKVPSYQTAVKTPARSLFGSLMEGCVLPDYRTATSAPGTPTLELTPATDPLAMIPEMSHAAPARERSLGASLSRPGMPRRRTYSAYQPPRGGEADGRRQMTLVQAR